MRSRPARLLVIDSSVLVALLAEAGDAGAWASEAVDGATLVAPQSALFEAANILRRHVMNGQLSLAEATLAHADLVVLPIQLWPYGPLAERAWELRENLTVYDAAYVALAELLGATLVTLDVRLAKAPGPACPIETFGP
jgi:predicted nucleic acid-binding protein